MRLAAAAALLLGLTSAARAGSDAAAHALLERALAADAAASERVPLAVRAEGAAESPRLRARAALVASAWLEAQGEDPGAAALAAGRAVAALRDGRTDQDQALLAVARVREARLAWWRTQDLAAASRALRSAPQEVDPCLVAAVTYRTGRQAGVTGLERALAASCLAERAAHTLEDPLGSSAPEGRLWRFLALAALGRLAEASSLELSPVDPLGRPLFAWALVRVVQGDEMGAVAHLRALGERLPPAARALLVLRVRREPDLSGLLGRPAWRDLLAALEAGSRPEADAAGPPPAPPGPPRVTFDLGGTQLVVDLPPGFDRRRIGLRPVVVGPGPRAPWVVYGDLALTGLGEAGALARLREVFPDGQPRPVLRGGLRYLVVELPLEGPTPLLRRAYLRPGEGHVLYFFIGAADRRGLDATEEAWLDALGRARPAARRPDPEGPLAEVDDPALRRAIEGLPNLREALTEAIAVGRRASAADAAPPRPGGSAPEAWGWARPALAGVTSSAPAFVPAWRPAAPEEADPDEWVLLGLGALGATFVAGVVVGGRRRR